MTLKPTSLRPVAILRTPFAEKFGIPRQSGLVPAAEGRVEFLPEFASPSIFGALLDQPARGESVEPDLGTEWIAVTSGSLLLIGMGLLHLGITVSILRVTIGLMTVLSGFEILYSAVEGSVLVAALLAIINLGLALTGSYLMIASAASESEISEIESL